MDLWPQSWYYLCTWSPRDPVSSAVELVGSQPSFRESFIGLIGAACLGDPLRPSSPRWGPLGPAGVFGVGGISFGGGSYQPYELGLGLDPGVQDELRLFARPFSRLAGQHPGPPHPDTSQRVQIP